MPLVKREIQPILLNRGLDIIPSGISNELECVTNFTLTSIIRQLSNVARQAEDVFMELCSETRTLYEKSNSLQDRIGKISAIVTQLDSIHDQGEEFCHTK